jgi:ATP-dependent exoDNAse (exonuclease V) alpha subunit
VSHPPPAGPPARGRRGRRQDRRCRRHRPTPRIYRAPDDHHRTITLAVGDEVILRRNHRLTQPVGTTVAVRNGMTGRVTATRRREITVELDAAHRAPGGPVRVTLPASYVGAHVEYGYARTVDTVQGATVDHGLFAPSASTSSERAYVELSRGRMSHRIYATRDRAWIDAIGQRRGHALAVDQSPSTDRTLRQVVRLGGPSRHHDRQPPLEVGSCSSLASSRTGRDGPPA